MKMTKTNIKNLRNEMNAELEVLAKKYGVTISVGNASYTNNNVTFKVEVANQNQSGLTLNKKATALLEQVKLRKLNFTLGSVIVLQGREFKVVGFNTRAKKFPIEIQGLDDNLKYKCSIFQANNAVQVNA